MKTSSVVACLTLSLFASAGLAQNTAPADKKDAPKTAQPEKKPAAAQPADKKADPADPMAGDPMGMDNAPGEMHKILTKAVGEWETKSKSFMVPGAPPEEATGKCVVRSLFDGRYTQVQYSGKMMGMPFQGIGIYGYDNGTKKFVSSWVDTMSTGISTGTGELSADKKTLTWTVEMTGPDGSKETMREVETFIDDNNSKLEMFMKNPADGKDMLIFEISYTRVKRDKAAKPTDAPKPETAAPATDGNKTPASAPKVAPASTPKLANPK